MTNFERYADIHNELMNRLEDGKITTEQAKELNDIFFDRYITEGAAIDITNIKNRIQSLKTEIDEYKVQINEIKAKIQNTQDPKQKQILQKQLMDIGIKGKQRLSEIQNLQKQGHDMSIKNKNTTDNTQQNNSNEVVSKAPPKK